MQYFRRSAIPVLFLATTLSAHGARTQSTNGSQGFASIDTSFENASPLTYEVVDGIIRVNLEYDHERDSPNRAAGHIHFLVHAKPGSKLTFEFRNLDNVWNGQPASVAGELKSLSLSEDGRKWRAVETRSLPGNRVQLHVEMPSARLYVARIEPYRVSDLDRLLKSIPASPRFQVMKIGKTAGGRDLEILRIGDPSLARYRVFVRARAHPWESGSSWVAQGLIQRLIRGDEEARRFLRTYMLYIMPMANKDGVALGRTRFNLNGKDLNRNWDKPADPELSPENAALEAWLKSTINAGRQPDLAIELHNDGGGRLHISRPPVPRLQNHLARMALFEQLLRDNTWFTEGSTNAAFRNSGTLGDGWLERFNIDAVVHELNCNWIEGVRERPTARHWIEYGEKLALVLRDYFVRMEL
jgi:hypothetical protein